MIPVIGKKNIPFRECFFQPSLVSGFFCWEIPQPQDMRRSATSQVEDVNHLPKLMGCWLLGSWVFSHKNVRVDGWWCLMMVDDGWWWLMMVVDGWWCLMMVDDVWWWLMMVDDGWWCLMMVDDVWWWLMMVDDGWWWLMMVDGWRCQPPPKK